MGKSKDKEKERKKLEKELRAAQEQAKTEAAIMATSRQEDPLPSILFVEDDKSSRFMVLVSMLGEKTADQIRIGEEYIHRNGEESFSLLCLDNVPDALAALNQTGGGKQRFDLILLDGQLPGGHGRQILEAVNEGKKKIRPAHLDVLGSIVVGFSGNPYAKNGILPEGLHADPGKDGFQDWVAGRTFVRLVKDLRADVSRDAEAAYMAQMLERCHRRTSASGAKTSSDPEPASPFLG